MKARHAAARTAISELLVLSRIAGGQRPPTRIADEDLDHLGARGVEVRQDGTRQTTRDRGVRADRPFRAGQG